MLPKDKLTVTGNPLARCIIGDTRLNRLPYDSSSVELSVRDWELVIGRLSSLLPNSLALLVPPRIRSTMRLPQFRQQQPHLEMSPLPQSQTSVNFSPNSPPMGLALPMLTVYPEPFKALLCNLRPCALRPANAPDLPRAITSTQNFKGAVK